MSSLLIPPENKPNLPSEKLTASTEADSTRALPTSGLEIANQLGVKHDEGVQVALFPEELTDISTVGPVRRFEGKQEVQYYGVIGNWMSQTRLLDVIVYPEQDVKWWKVKDFARDQGLDLVPVRWEGAIVDIPTKYFEPKTILGVRFYQHGPWFWPLEKPVMKAEVTKEEKELANASETLLHR